MKSGVVLLAAGKGQRYSRSHPKLLQILGQEPVFMRSLRVFNKTSSIREIVLVISPGSHSRYRPWLNRMKSRKKIQMTAGGSYRGESVRMGLKKLSDRCHVILVHDAARPLLEKKMIRRVERAAFRYGVALAAWPLPDTLKLSQNGGRVKKTIPRKNLWVAQTPQGFRRNIALKCLTHPLRSATDDVELAERRGYMVHLVEGGSTNLKLTHSTDMKVCRALLS